jgi:hypothetical protein
VNADNVPDLYPSLYPNVVSTGASNPGLVFAPHYTPNTTATPWLAFPYVFPGAYSKAQHISGSNYQVGWIHSPTPVYGVPSTTFDTNPLGYLQSLNHNPLDLGDNLPTSLNAAGTDPPTGNSAMEQTWWGFPTWRETLSPSWNDPTWQLNVNQTQTQVQPNGLTYGSLNITGGDLLNPGTDVNLLPPMRDPGLRNKVSFSIFRPSQQWDSDAAGHSSAFWGTATQSQGPLWLASWEDDLIMTGVRSFDVKAYDNALANYADLGWGDDFRLPQNANDTNYAGIAHPQAPYLFGNYDESTLSYQFPAVKVVNNQFFDLLGQTFAHEGRMPPLHADNRLDAQYPNPTYVALNNFRQQYPNIQAGATTHNFSGYSSNIGDNTRNIVRLRRVWDSWSTEYSRAPATGVYNNPGGALSGFPWGPPYTPPIYPSYPAPYPAPLRGIQIQIRVVDPTNQRIKSLTIRQDFTDKL